MSKRELPHLDKEAVVKVVEYASKISGDKEKISTRFTDISQVVGEAATWAQMDKKKLVTADYIDIALKERIERVKKYDAKYMEMIKRKHFAY